MTIGVPQLLGSGAATSSPCTFGLIGGSQPGDLLYCTLSGLGSGGSPATFNSITDGTNSYLVAAGAANQVTDGISAAAFYCLNAAAIASNATITVNFSPGTGSPSITARFFRIPGILAFDVNATTIKTSTSSSSVAVATSPLETAYELVIANYTIDGATTITESAGFQTLARGTGPFMNDASYGIFSNQSTATYSAGLAAASQYALVLAAFVGLQGPAPLNQPSLFSTHMPSVIKRVRSIVH